MEGTVFSLCLDPVMACEVDLTDSKSALVGQLQCIDREITQWKQRAKEVRSEIHVINYVLAAIQMAKDVKSKTVFFSTDEATGRTVEE